MSIDEHDEATLSAFADGENVGADELARALTTPGGRDALIDFVRLRERFSGDDAAPSETFYARMRPVLVARPPTTNRWRGWAAATAAAVVILALAGFALVWRQSGAIQPTPPRPDRVIAFESGTEWNGVLNGGD